MEKLNWYHKIITKLLHNTHKIVNTFTLQLLTFLILINIKDIDHFVNYGDKIYHILIMCHK